MSEEYDRRINELEKEVKDLKDNDDNCCCCLAGLGAVFLMGGCNTESIPSKYEDSKIEKIVDSPKNSNFLFEPYLQ